MISSIFSVFLSDNLSDNALNNPSNWDGKRITLVLNRCIYTLSTSSFDFLGSWLQFRYKIIFDCRNQERAGLRSKLADFAVQKQSVRFCDT